MVPLSMAGLAYAFWKRSAKAGILLVVAIAVAKALWSVVEGGEAGTAVIIPATLGLVVCIVFIIMVETRQETESRTLGDIIKRKTFTRKEQVLEAALDEFIANDYEKASLNAIIKNSGISKGVFYYHFENKEALYLFLLQESIQAKWAYINEQASNNQADFSKMDIFDKFLYQAELGAGFAEIHPKYHALSLMFSKRKATRYINKP